MLENLKTLLKTWKSRGSISQSIYNFLNATVLILSRIYGLSKILKQDYPLIIVSSISSPLHNLDSSLHKILDKNLNKTNSFIKNSFQKTKTYKRTKVTLLDDSFLVSLDVVSLFTNVPFDLVIAMAIYRQQYFIIKGRIF